MEKQVELREAKSVDVQCVVAGVSVLICMLAAVLGYESLSICSVMIFAVVCVMGQQVMYIQLKNQRSSTKKYK